MKEFLLNNWYYMILAVIALVSFILSFIGIKKKNKNANIFDSVKAALLENIPFWAIISESMASGEDKKNNVISLGIALVSKMMGRKITPDENDFFVAFISENLEKVLAAPQKKLEKAEIAQKSKYTIK